MQLKLERYATHEKSTLGTLSVDGHLQCWTLEDKVREVPGQLVSTWKIDGATAIPRGKYRVIIDYSNRFKRELSHVLDVPGFDGIRIHPGNTDVDTHGCILVGGRPTGEDFIPNSRATFNKLFAMMEQGEQDGQTIEIEVI